MDRDTAVARIKVELGFKTTLDTQIVTAMQEAQEQLERSEYLPYFLRSLKTMTTTASQETVALPTGFLREIEDEPLWYVDADGDFHKLHKDSEAYLRKNATSAVNPDANTPIGYIVEEANYRIFPEPDAVYNLQQKVYAADTVLSSNVENLWLKHASKILMGKTGEKIARGLRDKDAIATFRTMAAEGFRELLASDTEKEIAETTPMMGGED